MSFPLSYHQERIWFIDQFEKGYLYKDEPVYHNIPLILKFSENLNLKNVKNAINLLIESNEILRLNIELNKATANQVICEPFDVEIDELDLKTSSNKVDSIVTWCLKPFDLYLDKLFRVGYYGGVDETYLVFSFHHIIMDRPSIKLFIKALEAAYVNKISSNQDAFEYIDFALWQKEWGDEYIEPILLYWKQQIGKGRPAVELPEDTRRERIHIYDSDYLHLEFGKELLCKMQRICNEHDWKIDDFLQTAFLILLAKYSNQEELTVGVPYENRDQDEVKGILGPFSNLNVICSKIDKEKSFKDLVKESIAQQTRNLPYNIMPFDRLVKEINPENDMSRTALFDILFEYDGTPVIDTELGSNHGEVVETNLGYGKYDINLLLFPNSEKLQGTFVYNKLYFNRETSKMMVKHYIQLCESILSDTDKKISELSMLSDQEHKKIVEINNNVDVSYPKEESIISLFDSMVEVYPDNIAVTMNEDQITYKELYDLSIQGAKYFRSKGITNNDIIALVLDKSPLQIPIMFSVLRAGATYLPIDSNYPKDRIKYIIDDSNSKMAIFTNEEYIFNSGVENFIDKDIFNKEIIYDLDVIKPENRAYIIYTSGTTGLPKGVGITHENVVRLIHHDGNLFDFNSEDKWSYFHNYNFDFSVWEIFAPLTTGGQVVVIPKETARDSKTFFKLLIDRGITILNQTPSAFYNLVDLIDVVDNISDIKVRQIIFGGEVLNPSRLKDWYNKFPKMEYINMFGITETTVHVTYKKIGKYEIDNNISNIGRPIPTMGTYIVDDNGLLLPPGIPGELCVTGKGVSNGYLNRPELTSSKFKSLSFLPNEKVYFSGDIARLLPNGEIEYKGRKDHQVQIRGFRIELGEIDYFIRNYVGVKDSVTIESKDKRGNSFLVSYYTSDESINVNKNDLQQNLKNRLPDYMVPGVLIEIEALPLTANGKVNNKALPDPDSFISESDREIIKPNSNTEQLVLDIWKEFFDITNISVIDNFFHIGGNSLLVTQVLFNIKDKFGIDIPFPVFFSDPNIRSISKFIDNNDSMAKNKTNDYDLDWKNELEKFSFLENSNFKEKKELLEPKNILITGCTGFLGIFLLSDLQEQFPDAQIYIIVRAENIECGLERVMDQAKKMQVEIDCSKITVIIGDLEKEFLGIDHQMWNHLSKSLDLIVHNGAVARFIYSYENLYNANVKSVIELAKLAQIAGNIPFDYISTVSIFSNTELSPFHEDSFADSRYLGHAGGYSQTKWVSEQGLLKYFPENYPIRIHRPGRILGHSITGCAGNQDFLWQIIKASQEIGLILGGDMKMQAIPVDYVSKGIVHTIANNLKGIFHWVNQTELSLESVKSWFKEIFEIEDVSYDIWKAKITDYSRNNPESQSASLLPLLPNEDLTSITKAEFTGLKTHALLPNSIQELVYVNKDSFLRSVKKLQEQGYLLQTVGDKC